jgi:hypothetical protein
VLFRSRRVSPQVAKQRVHVLERPSAIAAR